MQIQTNLYLAQGKWNIAWWNLVQWKTENSLLYLEAHFNVGVFL